MTLRSPRLAAVAVVLIAMLAALAWLLGRHTLRAQASRHVHPSTLAAGLSGRWWSSLGNVHPRRWPTALDVAASPPTLQFCGVDGDPPSDDAQQPVDAAAVSSPASESEPAASGALVAAMAPMQSLPQPTAPEQRIFDAMRRAPDAFTRAAALVLAPSGNPDDPTARLNGLAAAAVHTSDPRLYSLAYRACEASAQPLHGNLCGLLSATQWARLDVGNGMPFVYVLNDAVRHGDIAARDDALFHIAASPRIDDRFFDVDAALIGTLPPDDDAATAAGFVLMGRAASTAGMPPFGILISTCQRLADNDANQRQTCSAMADNLILRGRSMILQGIGGGVDRSITGSSERADRLHAEREALYPAPQFSDYTCSGLRRQLQRFQRSAQIGELAALREASVRDVTTHPTALYGSAARPTLDPDAARR